MTPDPPDDDKCQVSMCCQAHFTYCPHCKLFVCIEHLNEHYANYKQEYQVLLNDGKQQQILNKQFIDDIETEKQKLVKFFNQEIEYYQVNDRYFHEKTVQTTIRPQDCADLRLHISESSQKRLQFKKFMHQIHQLINDCDYHQPNGVTNESSSPLLRVKNEEIITKPRINKSSPLAQFSIDYEEIDDDDDDDDGTATPEQNTNGHSLHDQQEKSNIPNGKTSGITNNSRKEGPSTDRKDSLDEPSRSDEEIDEDDESDNDNLGSDPDFGDSGRTVTTSIRRKRDVSSPKPAVNHFQVGTCPLADKLYGIDTNKHQLRHVPCSRSNISSIYLFTHLRVFHCLSSKASLRLVRHIMYNGCERDADLFSQSTESLVSILPKSYRGRCPLTKLGVFGLTKYHDIRLCEESQTHENTGLLNHFVVYHCLSYPWANKLCNAMQAGDADGSRQTLFKPNEPIKAKKWLTAQGKLILAKRYSSVRKRKKKPTINKRKK
ncbi:unnamed protein product [Adineta steineri]|uniref:Uncharacterized protein n=1 Tax=Adineta steineri TaxID=433720 RepID=A0A813WR19_9BILA|nr:unnamed protein product [Adineta steineri]CAF0864937.1 unnamed protein product [Adineta steineri]